MAVNTSASVHGDTVLRDARRVHREAIDTDSYQTVTQTQERFYLVELHDGERYAGDTDLPQTDDPNYGTWQDQLVCVYVSADGGRAIREHVAADDPLPHAIAAPMGTGTLLDSSTRQRYGGIVATAHESGDEWQTAYSLTTAAEVSR